MSGTRAGTSSRVLAVRLGMGSQVTLAVSGWRFEGLKSGVLRSCQMSGSRAGTCSSVLAVRLWSGSRETLAMGAHWKGGCPRPIPLMNRPPSACKSIQHDWHCLHSIRAFRG